jgi:hypothetical protein
VNLIGVIGLDYRMLALSCLLLALLLAARSASAYGSSVDDMVGAFSIEKTIKLGSSSACFGGADVQNDPLSMNEPAPGMDEQAPGIGGQPLIIGGRAPADVQPPALAGLDIDPEVVDRSRRSINLTAHIIDDGSGLSHANVFFCSPFCANTVEVVLDSEDRVSGTPKDGIYEGRIALSDDCERGAWLLKNMTMTDQSGSCKILNLQDIASKGWPVEFLVP